MRATANLPTRLERNLLAYATAASAAGAGVLAMPQMAEAKVVYTPVHVVLGSGGVHIYNLDLNRDGISEIELSASSAIGVAYWLSAIGKTGSVEVGGGFAAALPRGAEIGPKRPFEGGSNKMAEVVSTTSSSTFTRGPWVNVKNRYLGIKFHLDGTTHYGWARLSVKVGPRVTLTAKLTGYAYETIPDKPIIAGNRGSTTGQGPDIASEPASLGHLALGAVGRIQRHQGIQPSH